MPINARIDTCEEAHVIEDSMIGLDLVSPVEHGYWVPAWEHCGLNADWNERAWRLSPGEPNHEPGYYLFEDVDSWILVRRTWLEAEDRWEDEVCHEGSLTDCHQAWKRLGSP